MKLLFLLAFGATLAVVSTMKMPDPWIKISVYEPTLLKAFPFVLAQVYRETPAHPRTETLVLREAYRFQGPKFGSNRLEFRVHFVAINRETKKVVKQNCRTIIERSILENGKANYTLHDDSASVSHFPGASSTVACGYYY